MELNEIIQKIKENQKIFIILFLLFVLLMSFLGFGVGKWKKEREKKGKKALMIK